MRIQGCLVAFALALFAAFGLSAGAGSADAAIGDGIQIHHFEAHPSSTQAGGHPNLWMEFSMETSIAPVPIDPETGKPHPCNCNEVKDIVIDLPAGFVGSPTIATPRCSARDFAFNECAIDSQVGIAQPQGCLGPGLCGGVTTPVYSMIPPPGEAGMLAFKIVIFDTPVYTFITSRTESDYGLKSTVAGIARVFPFFYFQQELWGVPASPENDKGRFDKPCILICNPPVGFPSNSPEIPLLTNPTACGDATLTSTIKMTAYDGGPTTVAEDPWPATTGCSQLDFNPSLAAKSTTTEADSPSGVDVILTVPQSLNPTVPSPSSIRRTTTTLPEGFSINTNAGVGKQSCSDVQARFGTPDEAQCPESAKVGTLEIHTAILPGVLPGAIYLGEPQPGNRYRIFLVADGFGLHIKLPGEVRPDPETGQMVVDFKNLPQTPFEEFNMHFFGAERGALATPTKCGTYAVRTLFTPWNSALPSQGAVQFFTIDRGPGGKACPGDRRPFAPRFEAGSAGNTAGAHAPFSLDLIRDDGDQFLSGLSVSTPLGFSGKLAGVPYCPEAAIARLSSPLHSGVAELGASACPAASQIGTTIAGAGAGSRPLYQAGKVYLAGPYKGAPLSLVVVVPAVSGPYDLGNIAVRAQIQVDPVTGRVSTVSDPLPQIIEGIPLRTRLIRVNIDRPNFALNPTSCRKLSTDAQAFGAEGGQASFSDYYQVANCSVLPFEPSLGLKLRGSSKRLGHPSLQATLVPNEGDANIARANLVLPKSLQLDQANVRSGICTRVQWANEACPKTAIYGSAVAHSPLLDEPLSGPVYLRSSDNTLPDLAVDLEGQVDFELAARIDAVRGGLRTVFTSVPDVPVSKFVLRMDGGDRGLIVNSTNLCEDRSRARSVMHGQNGRRQVTRPKLQAGCGKARQRRAGKKKKRRAISMTRKAG